MKVEGTVTISLDDFKELEGKAEESETIKELIADSVTVKQIPQGKVYPKIKLIADSKILKEIIWLYHAWRLEDREWISDEYNKEEVEIVIRGGEISGQP